MAGKVSEVNKPLVEKPRTRGRCLRVTHVIPASLSTIHTHFLRQRNLTAPTMARNAMKNNRDFILLSLVLQWVVAP